MKSGIRRRTFLRGAGVMAAAATSELLSSTKEAAVRPLDSYPPPAPAGAPRLFPGCCAYSYRKYLQHGPMTMEDFILKGVEQGLRGVDMTVYYLKSTEPAYLANLRHLAFKN
ncbi:MAG TPA: sugar phosphate isomerase/epimerase, partial [Terriglobia bacterium]|nr:sugar phosphate isomerase/epimerase [Terriglobia bacterium]